MALREFCVDALTVFMFSFNQLALFGLSFVIYGLITTWQLSLLLVTILATHEYGHFWAMQRLKLRPKGIYFIPVLGAVTRYGRFPPTKKVEVMVVLAGPALGGVFAFALVGAFWITGKPFFAAGALCAAVINLFNLIPISPLDGGHVVKAIALSAEPRKRMPILTACMAATLTFAFLLDINLALNLCFFLPIWLFFQRGKMKKRPTNRPYDSDQPDDLDEEMSALSIRDRWFALAAHSGLALLLGGLVFFLQHQAIVLTAMRALSIP